MKRKPPVKPLDILIIILAVSLTLFSAYRAYAGPKTSSRVFIQGSKHEWIFPPDAEETVAVPGPLGITTIRISGGSAWVESSPCVNQVCVAAGRIGRQGIWTACLPNGVFLIMEGETGNEVDGAAW